MLQFGFLAAVFWWVIIAFNMSLEVCVLLCKKRFLLIFLASQALLRSNAEP